MAISAEQRAFWILSAWLAFVFLVGGGSRADMQSLVVLRPGAALVLVYAACTVSASQMWQHRWLLVMAGLTVLLVLVQLVPLPPSLWHGLPGRELVVEVERVADLHDVWRPLTLTPSLTRNTLWSLMVPLSVLFLAIQLGNQHLRALLLVLLGIGLVSALLGIIQIASDPHGPLYFYRITHNGSAVGLFANRNHQGVLLAALIPMVVAAGWIYRPGKSLPGIWARWAAPVMTFAVVSVLLPLVLVTGSRAGMLAAALAVVFSPLLLTGLRSPRVAQASTGKSPMPLLIVASALGLVLLTYLLGRAIAFDRLLGTDPNVEMRIRMIPAIIGMIGEYWPWGTGFGSFPSVYPVHEPDALLAPQYMNQAHNDWLDVPLSGGLPAIILLASALASLSISAYRCVWAKRTGAQNALMARLGLLILALFGLASVSDYPLRVPSLACLAIIAALWATNKLPSLPDRSTRHV